MTPLRLSRISSIVVGVYAALSAIGGLILGFAIANGTYVALGCLMAGLALACFLWWTFTRTEGLSIGDLVARFGFAGSSGLALYANVCWALWMLHAPLELRIIKDGRMGEHYWLGPATLAYAVFCYAIVKWTSKSTRQG